MSIPSLLEREGPTVRRGKSKQTYGTPPEFIRAASARFGALVCDLAAGAENAKAPEFYDEARNSLAVSWASEHPTGTLWLNPPFDNITPWAAKCAEESIKRHGLILLLIPASIGTDYFAQHINGKAFVLGLAPRMTFEGCTDPYPKDLMLCVYGYGLHGFDTWRWK